MPEIFLGYSRDDRRIMEPLRDYLRSRGLVVWTDEYLPANTPDYHKIIEAKIRNCSAMVVLLSPSANRQGSYVLDEINYARMQNPRKPIFPVVVAGTDIEAVPIQLSSYNYTDLRGRAVQTPDEVYNQLACELAELAGIRLIAPTAINVTITGDVLGQINVAGHDIYKNEVAESTDNSMPASIEDVERLPDELEVDDTLWDGLPEAEYSQEESIEESESNLEPHQKQGVPLWLAVVIGAGVIGLLVFGGIRLFGGSNSEETPTLTMASEEPPVANTSTNEPNATSTLTEEPTATATSNDAPTATNTSTKEPIITATFTEEPTPTVTEESEPPCVWGRFGIICDGGDEPFDPSRLSCIEGFELRQTQDGEYFCFNYVHGVKVGASASECISICQSTYGNYGFWAYSSRDPNTDIWSCNCTIPPYNVEIGIR
ncbi:MAG: TIR domain-containing protein [Anaerolineae bacterium]|nr:TIR domain-containing protein [Anaerolineae bacterium]